MEKLLLALIVVLVLIIVFRILIYILPLILLVVIGYYIYSLFFKSNNIQYSKKNENTETKIADNNVIDAEYNEIIED